MTMGRGVGAYVGAAAIAPAPSPKRTKAVPRGDIIIVMIDAGSKARIGLPTRAHNAQNLIL